MGEEYARDAPLCSDPHPDPMERPQESAAHDHPPATALCPPSHLPQPEAPPGLTKVRSTGVFSAAIAKRISTLKEPPYDGGERDPAGSITEFHVSGLKVIVLQKGENVREETETDGREIKGRVSFFSRSGCRDCGAVRSFFRVRGIPYVEINVDVFQEREKELVDRTGSPAVPAIFFNEKLLGGLVALNSRRNCREFEQRLREMAGGRCPEVAPPVPAYGFDDEEELRRERPDAMVRVLRQRLPIQDRIIRMKLVKNCFSGSDIVEVIISHLDRAKADLAAKSSHLRTAKPLT
ncbi:hypothetical protein OPV22_002393 [Ensete ventricosum]|uniref:Glutaredoxin domain-containing protein n=1 Tax=Ensete ventricosum TaxID=4639 RepID=A0AAV8RXW5_ENSVE|nr:hypothetical protein OPV22_002393 [Ensete ventricosum]